MSLKNILVIMAIMPILATAAPKENWVDMMLRLKNSDGLESIKSNHKDRKGRKLKGVDGQLKSMRYDYPVEMIWFIQDIDSKNRPQTQGKLGGKAMATDNLVSYFDKKREGTELEIKLIQAALDSMEQPDNKLKDEFQKLIKANPSSSSPEWLNLYSQICAKRRVFRLNLLKGKGAKKIVFAQRNVFPEGHWYANIAYRIDSENNKFFRDGGKLCIYDIETESVKALLQDPKGGFRDPVLNFDATKILFSWRKGDTPNYLIYEINIDGTGLRQVTHGKYDDFEPIYLPDGDMMFVSSRAKRWVNCYYTQVATIHRSDLNGKNIRRLSANVEFDNTPWLLNDGRVAYMRWEYVDRGQGKFHHLWVMNPDGTQQQALFGNMLPSEAYLDAKPIPGTKEIVMSANPAHGRTEHMGSLATLTVDKGPDDKSQMKCFSIQQFRDPYPIIDKNWFLAAWDNDIVLVNRNGSFELIYSSPDETIHEPRPVMAYAPPPIIPDKTDQSKTTGTLTLTDVRIGRNMAGIKEGEITHLMILESLPKPVNWGGGVFDQTSISYNGTFTLERVLGTVPVEPDGSASFEVPANTAIIFAALDKNGSMVKRMHSFLTVMPGEMLSCIGCHENRTQAVPSPGKQRMAFSRKPDKIIPIKGIPDIFDYPRDIQPILDKHCVKCHNDKKPNGRVILTGDRGIAYTQSYMNLRGRMQFFVGNNGKGNSAPRSVGDYPSELMKKILNKHHGVSLSQKEISLLRCWINAGGYFTSTYAALGTGHIFPNQVHWDAIKKKFDFPEIAKAKEVMTKQCASCHKGRIGLIPIEAVEGFHRQSATYANRGRGFIPAPFLQHNLYNMSNPEKSSALLAPLAKDAGGWATETTGGDKLTLNEKKIHKHRVIFNSKDDPGYIAIKKYIESFAKYLEKNPLWNSPDFIPNYAYFREMKRYGVLPEDYIPSSKKYTANEIDLKYYTQTWQEAWPEEIRTKVFNK